MGADEMSWNEDGNAVIATLYDNGEWQVHYGTDGKTPTEPFMKNIFSKREAYLTMEACIERVFGESE
jgi:hypothetical protein